MTVVANWNYRIVRHHDGNLSLCEVYYDKDGKVVEIITNPLFSAFTAGDETAANIITALSNALRGAEQPILDILNGQL